MNRFEQHIKQSLQSFEAEYDHADWSDMQTRISKSGIGKSNGLSKGLLIAASVLVTAGVVYYFTATHTETSLVATEGIHAQHVSAVNEKSVQSETNNQQTTSEIQKGEQAVKTSDADNNNSVRSKSVFPEKNVEAAINNTAENNSAVQEQPKKIETTVAAPLAEANAGFTATFRSDISKVCVGAPVHFIADNSEAACSYKWFFGDGTSSAEQNPSHIFAQPGTYSVKLHVASMKDKKQADQKNTITVVAAPDVRVDYSVSDDNRMLVSFEAEGDKVTDWKWSFGDKQTSSLQNPSHTYNKKGTYKAEVTAKNSTGCATVFAKDVILKSELDLLAPNAFSPDGDGLNDTWMPVVLQNGDYVFTLAIFDRAGNKVFSTADKNNSWNGGNAKMGDTFLWKASVKDKNGDMIPCQGLITIAE